MVIASGDKRSLLKIPGAWIPKESDIGQPLRTSVTPPSSKRTAYIKTLESPIPPTSCDPPPLSSAPIVIYSTPLPPCRTPTLSGPEYRVKEPLFTMQFSSNKAAAPTPQNTLSPSDGRLNTPSTLNPSSVYTPQLPSPQVLSRETNSTTSGSALGRRTAHRRVVQFDVHQADGRGTTGRGSYPYVCEPLSYGAGFRPHVYVDNRKHPRNKYGFANGLSPMNELSEDQGHGVEKSDHGVEESGHDVEKSKTLRNFRSLVQFKKRLKFFGRKPRVHASVGPRPANLRLPAESSMANSPGHCPLPPTLSPPSYDDSFFDQPTNVRSSDDSPFMP